MSKAEQAAKEFLKTKRIRNKQLLVTLPSREREYFQMNKLLEDFATSQPFNQQIEQLTQERDELKNDIENIKLKVKRISKLPESLTKQLSAEKQKNEELKKRVEIAYKTIKGEITSNVCTEHQLKQLSNK